MEFTTKIIDFQLYNEVLDYVAVNSAENNELTTTKFTAIKMIELPAENINIE